MASRRPSFARRATNVARAGITRQVSYFVRGEKAVLTAVRNTKWLQKLLLVLVPAAWVCAALVPYLMTGETSRRGAGNVCKDNSFEMRSKWKEGGDLELAAEEFESRYEYHAERQLYPAHTFNNASTFFSSVCFLLWVYFTPHRRASASALDLKRTFTHPTVLLSTTPRTQPCGSPLSTVPIFNASRAFQWVCARTCVYNSACTQELWQQIEPSGWLLC